MTSSPRQSVSRERRKAGLTSPTALFGPADGLIAKTFPNKADRAAFRKSSEYDALHKLLEQKIKETGLAAGAEPAKSGRFVVRLPKTLHMALEKEASAEGTSLNLTRAYQIGGAIGRTHLSILYGEPECQAKSSKHR